MFIDEIRRSQRRRQGPWGSRLRRPGRCGTLWPEIWDCIPLNGRRVLLSLLGFGLPQNSVLWCCGLDPPAWCNNRLWQTSFLCRYACTWTLWAAKGGVVCPATTTCAGCASSSLRGHSNGRRRCRGCARNGLISWRALWRIGGRDWQCSWRLAARAAPRSRRPVNDTLASDRRWTTARLWAKHPWRWPAARNSSNGIIVNGQGPHSRCCWGAVEDSLRGAACRRWPLC